MCHLYPYNNVKLLRKFFYINDNNMCSTVYGWPVYLPRDTKEKIYKTRKATLPKWVINDDSVSTPNLTSASYDLDL